MTVVGSLPTRHAVPDDAIDRLYAEQAPRLWAAVLTYVRDQAVAEEAVADAFSEVRPGGPSEGDPRDWIWARAFRIATDEAGRRDSLGAAVPDAECTARLAGTEVLARVADLPRIQRAAVLLHHYAPCSTGEAAEILGVHPLAFRAHVRRAHARLTRAREAPG